MALTPAEKQRKYREREQDKQRKASDSTYPYLKEPFSKFLEHEGNYQNVEIALALIGFDAPQFDDERGPIDYAQEDVIVGVEDPFPGAEGAIGRAEVIIDCLIDAATELASVVNNYKRKEIAERLNELENSKVDKAIAMNEAVTLNKINDQLNKQVRRRFHQWKVTVN